MEQKVWDYQIYKTNLLDTNIIFRTLVNTNDINFFFSLR